MLFYCACCFGVTSCKPSGELQPCEHCGSGLLFTIENWPGWSDYDRWFMGQIHIHLPADPIPPARAPQV